MPYKNLPSITAKEDEIVNLVYKFRFINRYQIQKFLGHKEPRRINAWLRDLVSKQYLGRIYSQKLLENTKPAIYFLHYNGVLWVRFQKGMKYGATNEELEYKHVKKFYQDKHASDTFKNHCIQVCEFYLQLNSVGKSNRKLEYYCETKTELWIQESLYAESEEIKVTPDMFIEAIKNPNGKNMDSSTYLLELFDTHVPRYALRYRVKQYIKLGQNNKLGSYSGLDGNAPIILLVVSSQQKINHLRRYIREQLSSKYEPQDIKFHLTTYNKAAEEGLRSNIWQ